MPYTISPFFRSPFTDITGGIVSDQLLGRCSKEEMDMMDCMEAYGVGRGRIKCQKFADEFFECQKTILQFKRFVGKLLVQDLCSSYLYGQRYLLSPRSYAQEASGLLMESGERPVT